MAAESLTPVLQQTLRLFDPFGPPLTTNEVAAQLPIGRRSTYERLERLVACDRLATKKVGANGRVWWRSPDAESERRQEPTRSADPSDDGEPQAEIAARFEALFESSPDLIDVLDAEGRLVSVNQRLCAELGYTEAELVGKGIWEYNQSIDAEGVERLLSELSVDEPRTFEARYRRADGSTFPVEVNLVRLDTEGRDRFMAISRDITERTRQRELLEHRPEVLRRMHDIIVDRDRAFCEQVQELLALGRSELDTASGTLSKISGEEYTFEIVDTDDEGIEPGDVVPVSATNCERVASDERTLVLGDVARDAPEQTDRDGYTEWGISCYIGAPVFVDDEVYGTFCFYGDEPREGQFSDWEVTLVDLMSRWVSSELDRKEREQQLTQYETIVETVTDGIYAVDEDATFVMVNEGFCELTGYERAELLGSRSTMVTDDEVTPKAETLSAEISAGDRETASIELDVQTAAGETVPCETRLAPFGTGHGRCGVTRDVSERLHREQELRARVRQQEVVTELGKQALEDRDLDELMVEAAELVADTLDNDYCKVLDFDAEAEELLLRQGTGWDERIVGSATVSAVEDESQASYTLQTEEPVVVSDLTTERRFSGPDLLTDHDVRSGISVIIGSLDEPWGILGSLDEPWGILGTHDTEPKAFSEQDANFVQSVANILATAITRHQYEQRLVAQRERVDALNNLHAVIRKITTAVIEQSTREEIEATVCERLADTDSYSLSWIGEVDTVTDTVAVRTEAGVTEYTNGITISVDNDDERAAGPTGTALQTGETQVVNDIPTDPSHDPWRQQIEAHGFRSSAAIPISHEGTMYGVLNVYADRPNAFAQQERAVIDQLGDVIGHAIAATERKRALMSTELVELEYCIRDIEAVFDTAVEINGTTTLDHVVPIADKEFLVYGTATDDAVESLTSLVDVLPHWTAIEFYSANDPRQFELRMSNPPILSEIASHGGYIGSACIEDGDYRMTIHLAPSADVSQVAALVRDAYPQVEMLRRQQITRPDEGSRRIQRRLSETLTDRQSTVLETAYHAGYFNWPRDNCAEDIASTLGISSATLHQHLRKAQKQVFDELLSNTTQQRLTPTTS